jgi:hypothetical protein
MPAGLRRHENKLALPLAERGERSFEGKKSSARGPLTQDLAVVEANIQPYFETSDSPVVCQASRHRKFRPVPSQIKMIGRRGGRNGFIAGKSSKIGRLLCSQFRPRVRGIDAKNAGSGERFSAVRFRISAVCIQVKCGDNFVTFAEPDAVWSP